MKKFVPNFAGMRVDEIAKAWAVLQNEPGIFTGNVISEDNFIAEVVHIWEIMNYSISANMVEIPRKRVVKYIQVRFKDFIREEDKHTVLVVLKVVRKVFASFNPCEALIRYYDVIRIFLIADKPADQVFIHEPHRLYHPVKRSVVCSVCIIIIPQEDNSILREKFTVLRGHLLLQAPL